MDTGKAIPCAYIKATVGFEKLGADTGSSPKSLVRMFGPTGNPQAHNLFSVRQASTEVCGTDVACHRTTAIARWDQMRIEKFEIAKAQLMTAVDIFLGQLDRSSVITLAGAASGILDGLVKKAGKEPFVDYARRVHQGTRGHMPKRQSFAHHIEKRLGITPHKHLSKDDPETVELDLEKMALDALGRAIVDYIELAGQDEPFVKAYLQHTWTALDGNALMQRFEGVPKHLRPKT